MQVVIGWLLASLPLVHTLANSILGPQADVALNNIETGLPQVINGITAIAFIIGAKFLRQAEPKK